MKNEIENVYRENEGLKKQQYQQKYGLSGLVMPSAEVPEYLDEETKKKLQFDLLRPLLMHDLPMGPGARSEMEKIISTYKEREKLMLTLVQEYREKNSTLKLNTAKEFEDLQKLMNNSAGGMSRTRKGPRGPTHYGVAQEIQMPKAREGYAKEVSMEPDGNE